MNAHLFEELSGRIRKEGQYSTRMLNCLNAVHGVGMTFNEKRAAIAKDKHLSDVGRKAKLAETAKATVKDVMQASKMQRSAMAQVVGGRMNMKPKPVACDDARGELRRQEIRAFVRSQPPEKRIGAAIELAADSDALDALLDQAPQLSGLLPVQFETLGKMYAERHFGERLAELDGIESDAQVAGAGVEAVLNELRRESGMHEASFAEHVRSVTAEVDKGW